MVVTAGAEVVANVEMLSSSTNSPIVHVGHIDYDHTEWNEYVAEPRQGRSFDRRPPVRRSGTPFCLEPIRSLPPAEYEARYYEQAAVA